MFNNLFDTARAVACSVCGGNCVQQQITLTLRRSSTGMTQIRNVPADVCQSCGEQQFSIATAGQLIMALQQQSAPAEIAIMPIYDFGQSLS